MTKKALVVTVILILLFLVTGILVGAKFKKTASPSGQENTYQAGWDAAKKELTEKCNNTKNNSVASTKSLSGVIKEINGQTISLENAFISDKTTNTISNPTSLTISVSGNTKFYQITQKDKTQFQQEMDDFQKKIQEKINGNSSNDSQPLTSPQAQEKKELTLSDLKTGLFALIELDDNSTDKNYIAKEIDVPPMSAVPSVQSETKSTTTPTATPTLPMSATNNSTATKILKTTAPTVPVTPAK